jgi:CRISPR-associated protein Cas5d
MTIWNIRAYGSHAMYTPAGFRAERHSQLIGSHDAMEGLLRGVVGKIEMRWRILEAQLLSPPRPITITQNELTFDTSPPRREQHHTQRRNTYLRNYEILITAHIELSPKAERHDTLDKFNEMFYQRMRRGATWRQTYFGIRECMATLELCEGPLPQPIPLTQSLGILYYGMDFDDPETPRYFYPMQIVRGVVRYPSWREVRELGISAPVERRKYG